MEILYWQDGVSVYKQGPAWAPIQYKDVVLPVKEIPLWR